MQISHAPTRRGYLDDNLLRYIQLKNYILFLTNYKNKYCYLHMKKYVDNNLRNKF
jgi:hypothetical protein